MSNTDRKMQEILRKLNSVQVQETFNLLTQLIEELEVKDDPEPFEIHFVNDAYQLLEKVGLVRGMMNENLSRSPKLKGSRLQDLYDREPSSVGTQSLFDYTKKG